MPEPPTTAKVSRNPYTMFSLQGRDFSRPSGWTKTEIVEELCCHFAPSRQRRASLRAVKTAAEQGLAPTLFANS